MDTVVEDEKKPFDAVEAPGNDDGVPDPDEELMLSQGSGKVWVVKIPRYLMERWKAITDEDVHLATIRFYHNPNDPQKPRIILFLPPNRDPVNTLPTTAGMPTPPASQNSDGTPKPVGPSLAHPHITNWPIFEVGATLPTTGSEPDIYELDMIADNVDNQITVAERPKEKPPSRSRNTILTGRVKHECNLRPAFGAMYRRQMRERHRKYNTPAREIKWMDENDVQGGRGAINRLSAGVGLGGSGFSNFVKTKGKPAKGTFERMARMPKNQLLDQLFSLFREQPRWAIKPLRERTQQPEAYLKEVLQDIASLHRSGEYNGLWELQDMFKDNPAATSADVPGSSMSDVKMEDGDEDEDDDEDDDDMEEIS